ncbi:MAG TPA: hypothetical protein VEM32_11470 [Geobacteraceae bacterium]|nr:hypothetical protein [Geobacteraceae bacterium]
MFLALGISPVILIVVAYLIILGSHIMITAGAILVLAAMILGSAVLTAAIITVMHLRMSYVRRSADSGPGYQAGWVSADQRPPSIVSGVPLAVEVPREVHNHLHLGGLDAGQLTAVLRDVYGGSSR